MADKFEIRVPAYRHGPFGRFLCWFGLGRLLCWCGNHAWMLHSDPGGVGFICDRCFAFKEPVDDDEDD